MSDPLETSTEQALRKSRQQYEELLADYKRVVEALHENEIRYRSLFQNNMDAIFLTVPDGTVTAANPAACAMLDMTEEEICRGGRQGIVVPYDGEGAKLEERLRTGKIKLEQEFIRRDGTRIMCEVSSVILPGDGLLAFVIHMTSRSAKRRRRPCCKANNWLRWGGWQPRWRTRSTTRWRR